MPILICLISHNCNITTITLCYRFCGDVVDDDMGCIGLKNSFRLAVMAAREDCHLNPTCRNAPVSTYAEVDESVVSVVSVARVSYGVVKEILRYA